MKTSVVILLALVLLLTTEGAHSINCDSKCEKRCSKSDVKEDKCLKNCGSCCEQCKCVPSGTSQHKNDCGCYWDMKNSKGKNKCP